MPGEEPLNPKIKTRSVGLLVIAVFILLILPFIFHDTHPAVDQPEASDQQAPMTQLAEPIASPATVFPLSPPHVPLAAKTHQSAPPVLKALAPSVPVASPDAKKDRLVPLPAQPIKPITKQDKAPKPAPVRAIPRVAPQAAAPAVVTPKPPAAAPPTQPQTSTGPEVFWTVQLLSLTQEPAAAAWADRLRQAGYDAYYRRVEFPGGPAHYRVFSGPVLTKARAQARQKAMKTQFRLAGLVRVYRKP